MICRALEPNKPPYQKITKMKVYLSKSSQLIIFHLKNFLTQGRKALVNCKSEISAQDILQIASFSNRGPGIQSRQQAIAKWRHNSMCGINSIYLKINIDRVVLAGDNANLKNRYNE